MKFRATLVQKSLKTDNSESSYDTFGFFHGIYRDPSIYTMDIHGIYRDLYIHIYIYIYIYTMAKTKKYHNSTQNCPFTMIFKPK